MTQINTCDRRARYFINERWTGSETGLSGVAIHRRFRETTRITMTVSRPARRIEAVGNVLKFPVLSTHAVVPRPSFRMYYFAGAVLLLAALGGTGGVLRSLSQNSALAVIAPPGVSRSDTSNHLGSAPTTPPHHGHVRAPHNAVRHARIDG
ncbi:MAG: hypothetical protein WAL80_00445 [Xanthobacteraceae bacterium]